MLVRVCMYRRMLKRLLVGGLASYEEEACSHKSQPLTVSDSVGERRVYHKTVVEVNALSARITERAPINGACSLSAERLRARHTHLKTLLVRCGGPRAVAAG